MRENSGLKIFLIVLFLIFAGHQLYSSFYKPVSTETAQYFEVVSGVTAQAVIIRNESLITNSASGALHYITADGSRAAKGGTIAEIYADPSVSGKISRMQAVQKELESINQIEEYNNVQATDMELVNAKVSNALSEVIVSVSSGDFDNVPELSDQLLMSINRRQVLTGELTDFSVRKATLNEELESLKASIPSATGRVAADISGYFVSMTDGYEQILKPDDLTAFTPEYLDSLAPGEIPDNSIGKIVSDYEWYMAVRMGVNDSLKYKTGDNVTVKTTVKSAPDLDVRVECINMSSDSSSAVVVFSCQQMNSDLASMREGGVTVVSKVYKGLRLSKKDLRVVDGVTGVYTVSGLKLKFVPVNVIYSTEDFIICEQKFSDDNVLRLYDEVVVRGKGLYDGKIIS